MGARKFDRKNWSNDDSSIGYLGQILLNRDYRFYTSSNPAEGPKQHFCPLLVFLWLGNGIDSTSDGHQFVILPLVGGRDPALSTHLQEDSINGIQTHASSTKCS